MNIYLSVIMSVYNEAEDYIVQAIESVLNQTLSEFEFIIVNDNPERKCLSVVLEDFRSKDSRIVIVENETNMGLANSMNKAAALARSPYLVRMDADDICEKERFSKEYDSIINGDYDLIYSGVSIINQEGMVISEGRVQHPAELTQLLSPFNIYIQHPTVIMKKTVFNKLGGYRDFIYAQDRDLWLRMLSIGCRFYFVSENLLRYRIHSNATSTYKLVSQSLCALYATDLYIERNRYGHDSFSKERLDAFIKKHYRHISYNAEKVQAYSELQMTASALSQNGSFIKALFLRLKVLTLSRYHRRRSIFMRIIFPIAIWKRKLLYTLFCTPEKVKVYYE